MQSNDKNFLFDCHINEKLVEPLMNVLNKAFSIKSEMDHDQIFQTLKNINQDTEYTEFFNQITKFAEDTISTDTIRILINKAFTAFVDDFCASTYLIENLLSNIEKHFKEVKFTDSTIYVYHPENTIDKIITMLFLKSMINNLIYFSYDDESDKLNDIMYGVEGEWLVLQNTTKGSMFPSISNKPKYMRKEVLSLINHMHCEENHYKFWFIQLLTAEDQIKYLSGFLDLLNTEELYIAIEGIRDAEFGFQITPFSLCVSSKPDLVFGYKNIDENTKFDSIDDLVLDSGVYNSDTEIKIEDTGIFRFYYPERTLDNDIALYILDKMMKGRYKYIGISSILEGIENKYGFKKTIEYLSSAYDHTKSDMNVYPGRFSIFRTGYFGTWCATIINIYLLSMYGLTGESQPIVIDIYKLPKSTYKLISIHVYDFEEDQCRALYEKYIPKIINPNTCETIKLSGELELDEKYKNNDIDAISITFVKNECNITVPYIYFGLCKYNKEQDQNNQKYHMRFDPPDAIPLYISIIKHDPITDQPSHVPGMIGILTRTKIE